MSRLLAQRSLLATTTLLTVATFFHARTSSEQTQKRITVGANVLISGDRPDMEHGEAVICASPVNRNHLVAAAASTTGGKDFQGPGETTGEIV